MDRWSRNSKNILLVITYFTPLPSLFISLFDLTAEHDWLKFSSHWKLTLHMSHSNIIENYIRFIKVRYYNI